MKTNVTMDGTAYDLCGPSDRPPVVLIHGLGLCRSIWADYIPALCENYYVINYDLYGHGQSAPPPETASLAVYSKQILNLIDELGIYNVNIIGFSIGGMINRRFALDWPTRLKSLVILNSPHDRGEEAQKQVEERAQKVRNQGAMATMDAALERWFTPEFRAAHPETLGLVKEWRQLVDADSYAQAAWVLANGVRELIEPQTQITCPTLVMTCENDTGSTPEMGYAISAEISGAETQIIPHLQHLGLIEHTDKFLLPILDFLERTNR